jgi:hypothetical protein
MPRRAEDDGDHTVWASIVMIHFYADPPELRLNAWGMQAARAR